MSAGPGSRGRGLQRAVSNTVDVWLLVDSDLKDVRERAVAALTVLAKVAAELRLMQLEYDARDWGTKNELKTPEELAAARFLGVASLPRHPGVKDKRPVERVDPTSVEKISQAIDRRAWYPSAHLSERGNRQVAATARAEDEQLNVTPSPLGPDAAPLPRAK